MFLLGRFAANLKKTAAVGALLLLRVSHLYLSNQNNIEYADSQFYTCPLERCHQQPQPPLKINAI